MSSIHVEHLPIKPPVYHDRSPSPKDYFANIFQRNKKFSFTDFWAVKGIFFGIKAGDRVGVVGHNDAGKSTLLKALCRFYEPSAGNISIIGRDASLLEIGAGLHTEFTGRENIYLNGTILGYGKQQLKKIEPEVIASSELEEFIDTQVKYYSTGLYMRLASSLATVMHSGISVLDEIFAGGDAAFIEKAKARVYNLIDKTSIMIMMLVKSLCNRVPWLDHGKLVADGSPDEVVDRYLVNRK